MIHKREYYRLFYYLHFKTCPGTGEIIYALTHNHRFVLVSSIVQKISDHTIFISTLFFLHFDLF